MKKIVLWSLFLVVSISMLVTFLVGGCATEKATEEVEKETEEVAEDVDKDTAEEEWVIVDVPKLSPTPYFDRGVVGLELASEKFGIDAYQLGNVEFDSSAQIKIIEDLIAKDVDAILVCAIDPNSMVPVLKKAMDNGILTMSYSSPVDESAITWDVRSLDDEAFGRHLWDTLVQFMGESGDYAVLTGQMDTPDHTLWFEAGTEYAKEEYPNLNLVTDRIPTNEELEVAYETTVDLLKTYPDLKGLIGLGVGNPPGIAKAIRDKELIGEVAVVGSSMPSMSKEYLKDGSQSIGSLWDPKWVSYIASYIAMLTLEGEDENIVDGMEIPEYGKVKVDGKVIIPGGWIDFTGENVDDYPF
jgi:simple sugar transport system substrate-binding protein